MSIDDCLLLMEKEGIIKYIKELIDKTEDIDIKIQLLEILKYFFKYSK